MKCRICGNERGNHCHVVKEMMFGFRDSFDYFQCTQCGCLQIARIPSDMSRYYPPSYYSLARVTPPRAAGGIRGWARVRRDAFAVVPRGVLGKILHWMSPNEELREAVAKHLPGDGMALAGLRRNSRILDVGCGSGSFLRMLHAAGFRKVQGIDLFLEKTIEYGGGLRILKGSLEDCSGEWDIIMFHHSFEHLPDPLHTLTTAARRLARRGTIVVRIPLVSSYAWERYGVSWVQLDAPRHFFLHSTKSLPEVAARAGLRVVKVTYDSTEFQFWGSEQYLRDISLYDKSSYGQGPEGSIFSPEEIQRFKALAEELNASQRGDQAAFYLKKL
jgi:SAM-dependent methyltransferase